MQVSFLTAKRQMLYPVTFGRGEFHNEYFIKTRNHNDHTICQHNQVQVGFHTFGEKTKGRETLWVKLLYLGCYFPLIHSFFPEYSQVVFLA
jgi:hypothetical protein